MAYSPTYALDCWVHRMILGFEGRLGPSHYEWLAGHSEDCEFSTVTFSWKFWLEDSIQVLLKCSCGAVREVKHALPFDPRVASRQDMALDGGWPSQDHSSPVQAWQDHYKATLEASPHTRYALLRRMVSRDPPKMWLSPYVQDSAQYQVSSQGPCSYFPGRLSPDHASVARQVLYRPPSLSGSLPAVYGPAFRLSAG